MENGYYIYFFICWLVGFKDDNNTYTDVKPPVEELMNLRVSSYNINVNDLLNPYILSISFS